MTRADILEESENLNLERIATVRDKRGNEGLINVDALVCGWADLLSDMDNELAFGWTLDVGWFVERLDGLRAIAEEIPE